jgi:hypothetical protein
MVSGGGRRQVGAANQQGEDMARYALIYGLLSGTAIVLVIIAGMTLGGFGHSLWFGYLAMLVALTFIFVGVKRYRDVERGGVVRFWRALAMALGIAGVATCAYVAVWEVYLALTHYAFMDEYIASMMRNAHAHGVTGPALAKLEAEAESMRAIYANPLLRMGMTAIEIAPVGVVVAIFSAALLCFPRVLPARRA